MDDGGLVRTMEMENFPLLSDVKAVMTSQCNSLCASDAAVNKPVVWLVL